MPSIRLSCAAVVLAAAVLLSACDQPPLPQAPGMSGAQRTPIAVIDLDAVSQALGRDLAMREQLQSASEAANAELGELVSSLREQFESERRNVGDNPSQAQREDLARLGLEIQARVQQEQQTAQRRTQQLQVQLVQALQSEVRPVAAAVAAERGAIAVIPTSFLLWASATTDITDAVVQRMQAAAP